MTLTGCDAGDIGSSSSNSSAVVDNSQGATSCSYRCEPVEGVENGFLVTQDCEGVVDGPTFFENVPNVCVGLIGVSE